MATAIQISTFIEQIAPIIKREAVARGYKVCSPIIAQACIESAFGTSSLGYKYHNYFGMKCGSSWKGKSVKLSTKEEYTVGTLTSIKDNFRVYDSMEEGVKGYFDFISTKRYENLKSASTPREFLERIKTDGYATSSSYVTTNINCVNKYALTKYDGVEDPNKNPYVEPVHSLKKGSKGNSVRWLQYTLNKRGAHLVVDGIFGYATGEALIKFQQDHNLIPDGICGPATLKAIAHDA